MKRALCIWLPNWPVQRLAAARPELKGEPIVLYETCRGARRVTACSAQAEALGIAPGMPLAEATALSAQPKAESGKRKAEVEKRKLESGKRKDDVEPNTPLSAFRFPLSSSFIIHHSSFSPFPSDPLADREALEELAAWCQRFSPIVGIDSPPHPSSFILHPPPDSLLLDITGLEHLFGGEAALAEKIVRDFADRGLVFRVAIADTLGAAWAVAHFGKSGKPVPAKLVAESGKQDIACALTSAFRFPLSAFFVVPPGQTLPALRPLPIEALRLPAQVVELLHSLGVYRIEQLEPLPRAELAARFGPSIALRWDQATGQAAEPIPASPLPADLQARESLEYPTARRDAVELVLQRLIGQVAQKLLGCGRGAMRLQCCVECSADASLGSTDCKLQIENCKLQSDNPAPPPHSSLIPHPSSLPPRPSPPAVEFSVGLFEPTASAQHLFQLVQLQLERLSIPAPVTGISVEVSATAPLVCRQEGLFADGPGQHRPRVLAGLVDRLASRLGRNAVVRPRLIPDAQPESAYQYEPLIREKRKAENGKRRDDTPLSAFRFPLSSSFIIHHSSFLPLRLFRSPHPLAAMSVMPEGPPLRFPFRGQEHRIARAWGPERIETGWWRGRPIARDYYRIETTAGRRFWLFRRLDDGRWFLHGTFE